MMPGKGSVLLALGTTLLAFAGQARAQSPTAPPPAAGESYALPPIGSTAAPPAAPPAGVPPARSPAAPAPEDPAARAARMEAQIQQLQLQNQLLLNKFDVLSRQYEALQNNLNPFVPTAAVIRQQESGGAEKKSTGGSGGSGGEPAGAPKKAAAGGREPDVMGIGPVGSGGTGGEPSGVPGGVREPGVVAEKEEELGPEPYKPDMDPARRRTSSLFQEGIQWASQDNYFSLVFHNLSQLDYREFQPGGDPLHSQFIVPRQRWYFQGNVSPYANYYAVINRGYGSLDILDTWVDYNLWPEYKDQLQIRVGRMKTPYTYEYIKISESDLIAPERSLFVGNFAGNRQDGAMAHGRLFDRTVEYYAGVFNGPRRSFQDFNDNKDWFFFLNTKPFLHSDICFLRQLNVGGSINWGTERNPVQPALLQTAADQSTSATLSTVSPTFMEFNSNAFENGSRAQWSGDVAYYYKSFTMLAGYQGGWQDYSLSGATPPTAREIQNGTANLVGVQNGVHTHVPMLGWSVAATYFLTGEEITRRVYLVEPRRPFGWNNGQFGPGAIELYSRVANLQLSDKVFTSGLVDPALWSNRATTVDTGINWYLNHYIRMYFDWQWSDFYKPIFLAPGATTKHMDLYWIRTQVFF
jgi:phosphate-selective porin OprO/OprP